MNLKTAILAAALALAPAAHAAAQWWHIALGHVTANGWENSSNPGALATTGPPPWLTRP
jgi:hypothetical protein